MFFIFFLIQSAAEWRTVFFVAGSVYVFGLIFYNIFGSGKKQDWADGYTAIQPITDEDEDKQT